jgi:molybdopterin synthase catalytic subunit
MFHAAIINPKKTKKRINLVRAEKFIKNFDAGASIFFVGNIRKNNNNRNVTGVAYDAFDRLAIKTFKKIYNEGIKKFKLKKIKVFIEHAKGYVTVRQAFYYNCGVFASTDLKPTNYLDILLNK